MQALPYCKRGVPELTGPLLGMQALSLRKGQALTCAKAANSPML